MKIKQTLFHKAALGTGIVCLLRCSNTCYHAVVVAIKLTPRWPARRIRTAGERARHLTP